MNLSKIPESSERDLGYAKLLMEIVDYEKLTHHDKAHARIIAHFLRHGSVLAKNIDLEMVDSEQLGSVMVAIEFFEKFGGSDER